MGIPPHHSFCGHPRFFFVFFSIFSWCESSPLSQSCFVSFFVQILFTFKSVKCHLADRDLFFFLLSPIGIAAFGPFVSGFRMVANIFVLLLSTYRYYFNSIFCCFRFIFSFEGLPGISNDRRSRSSSSWGTSCWRRSSSASSTAGPRGPSRCPNSPSGGFLTKH